MLQFALNEPNANSNEKGPTTDLLFNEKIDNVFTGRPLVWVTYRAPAPSPGLLQSSVPLLGALLTASALLCSPSLALASLDQPSHACTLTFSDQRVLNQSLLLLYNSGTASRVPQFWK